MVHRPPDTRLLANLIDHEKEYAKHLAALLPLSHAALASLSAYAAASPSSPASPANAIATAVDALASIDDALHRYTHAIDTWRQQLVALKGLEDDLAAVLRDRDILVTRLIKASKSTRDAHRSSRLVAPLTALGSASLSSLPSTNSTAGSSPASTNSKLAQAQAELQACEAHLVAKERELDARRISVARDGLGARCRALIDCGWVWSEMGKQGLKALQALSPDERATSHPAPKASLAIPPHPVGTNHTTYASDNSSLTPSQSASQTAPRSVETSYEGPTSKEHERVQPETELETISKSQARSSRINDDGDLTITLPPAHAISELAFPTSVRTQSRPLENGDPSAAANASINSTNTTTAPEPALRRKHKRSRRPPSRHIVEVSDEGSDEPFSSSNRNSNVNASPRLPHAPLHVTPTHDTSSDDEHPVGPLRVVENDPFGVIRRSMLGSGSGSLLFAPIAAPTACASAPDVRASIVDASSPSKAPFPSSVSVLAQGAGTAVGGGPSPGSSPARRRRKTSMALFGSLRGLFRKPRERDRLGAEWNEGYASPTPNRTRVGGTGWVTRTDARIKSRGGQEDSDEAAERTSTTPRASGTGAPTTTTNVVRAASGARLRKGRPSASSARENGPSHRTGVDGWITDGPGGQSAGTGVDAGGAGTSAGRSRTRRGTVKRKKTSVGDLRGSEQGHTDAEGDGGRRSPERLESSKGKVEKAPEAETSGPRPAVGQERQLTAPTDADLAVGSNLNGNADPGPASPQDRTTTTMAIRKPSSDIAAPPHRRSASLSLVDAHVTAVPRSTSTSTGGIMSWRKPPPQIESQPASLSSGPSQSPSLAPAQAQAPAQPSTGTQETQPKQTAKRHLGNGHAKHVQNQSLMSIVADVTRLNQGRSEERERVARSLDIPRAPGSVVTVAQREVGGAEREVNGRGHARTTSIPEQGPRAIKLPLRSALRNASRTPSPGPAIVPVIEVKQKRVEEERGRAASPPWRDSASISSYETGRESLDGEGPSPQSSPVRTRPSPLQSPALPGQPRSPPVRSQSQPPTARRSRTSSSLPLSFTFPPPPVDPPPVRGGTTASNPAHASANANEASGPPSSRTSTETPPVRRKSVRVSLQPTYSPAPPPSYDEHGDGYTQWSEERERGAGSSRPPGDVWADSSEEDEAYSRARRLLSLVGRGKA